MTTVKNNAGNMKAYGLPAYTPVPVAVPPQVDPQAVVDYWTRLGNISPYGQSFLLKSFADYWRPHGSNDYKEKYGPMYDQLGNVLYGASGTAAGFSETKLQGAANLVYLAVHGKDNIPQNVSDIQTGIDTQNHGATFSVREYTPYKQSSFEGTPPEFDQEANGGFVIYPNKPNINMMRSVYAK